jgi:hypothetical protein
MVTEKSVIIGTEKTNEKIYLNLFGRLSLKTSCNKRKTQNINAWFIPIRKDSRWRI